ncbi:unnamed protein product [Acanthosepion pharaonis]|uniref:Uncharacterized protein n=1 Tax=Acanthosepion pharaonis TaxID=158019 RepID=A0A812APL8_ACAPH|nr:unnamed protein product [Sepia pharaonis]
MDVAEITNSSLFVLLFFFFYAFSLFIFLFLIFSFSHYFSFFFFFFSALFSSTALSKISKTKFSENGFKLSFPFFSLSLSLPSLSHSFLILFFSLSLSNTFSTPPSLLSFSLFLTLSFRWTKATIAYAYRTSTHKIRTRYLFRAITCHVMRQFMSTKKAIHFRFNGRRLRLPVFADKVISLVPQK